MALAFKAVIPQTSTPWEFTRTSLTSFSYGFSRPRKQIIRGNFPSFAAKIESPVSDVEQVEVKEGLASTSFNNGN